MATAKEVFDSIGTETLKGQALHFLKDSTAGAKQVCNLRLAANVANTETITLGSDVFEIHQVNTDTTANVASGQLNNTLTSNTVTIATHGLTVGRIIRVENEYMKVTKVIDVNNVEVSRGYAGSTIATHADTTDIFKGAAAHTAGRIPLPVGATLTPTAAGPLIVSAINALNNSEITAVAIGTNELLLTRPADGNATACSETLAGANNTIDSAFRGGVPSGNAPSAIVTRVPTATEIVFDQMHFVFPFTVTAAHAFVKVTSGGAAVAWDGAVSFTGNRVTVTNAGTTDWTASHTVMVVATGS